MSLPPGTGIGHYEIRGPLGEGGMGVVYRARDSKLKRDVALKVLPPDVAGNAERLARFQREAEVLAALNHPHIAQIYGIEESGGHHALVMEVVEGPTLADRIHTGGMPVDEVIVIARQIIDALAYAHDHHIVHRDLKPANIKLTQDGAVKVLDFGLAKALDPPSAASGLQGDSPTITSPAMTRVGMFLGTAAYMAPEQARGAVVDKRADIWAFGVVLFEMLTGRRLFEGETVSDTLANVLKLEPDFSTLPGDTPAGLRRLIRHCLVRDRKQRLQDIGDARFDLDAADPHAVSAPSSSRVKVAAMVAAAFAAGLAAALLALPRLPSSEVRDPRPIQFQLTGAAGTLLEDPAVFAVAPNGRLVALRAYEQGTLQWYLYSVDSGTIRKLDGTRNATNLVFSPDSQWAAFTAGAALSKIKFDAMRIEQVTPTGVAGTATAWLESGDILTAFNGEIHRTPPGGGAQQPLLSPKPTSPDRFGPPTSIPGTNTFLTTTSTGAILLGTVTGETWQLETGGGAAYADGRLLSLRGSQLLTWPLDLENRKVTGPPQVLVDNVLVRSGASGRAFAVSQDLLAYRTDLGTRTQLLWIDRNGEPAEAIKMPLDCRNPEVSPDGRKVAVECYEGASRALRDIWIYDLERGAATRFTTHAADDSDPVWSPDGKQVAFTSNRNGPSDIFVKGAGGAGEEQLLAETPGATPLMAWSPNGQVLALYEIATQNLVAYDLTSKSITPILASPFLELEFQFSPNGRFFSYASDESGRNEIYVQPWPPNGEKWQISTNGGNDARWRRDGKEIYFVDTARDLIAASVDTTQDFKAGATTRLFNTRIAGPIGLGHRFPYAVSRDGSRFLVYVNEGTDVRPSITVVLNWLALLDR